VLRAACCQPGPSSNPSRASRSAWRASRRHRSRRARSKAPSTPTRVSAGRHRGGDHAAGAHAVFQGGGRALAHGGQHGVRRVAGEDYPPAHVAGAPARKVVDVMAQPDYYYGS
jgi:hypothetical protein